MRRVTVIMSTYNGEEYLAEQIDSIIAQDGVQVSLLVRDDGSSDTTVEILKEYEKKGLLTWYCGDNLKPALSFLDLIQHVEITDYIAFSDQDDVWLNDKLISAIEHIERYDKNEMCLYCSANTLVDEQLNPISKNTIAQKNVTYGSVLLKCCAIGCTFVFNEAALSYLKKISPSDNLIMHDAWILRIIASVGTIIYDKTPHILYRQHSNNQIGSSRSLIQKWISRFRRRKKISSGIRSRQIDDIYERCINDIHDADKRKLIELLHCNKTSLIKRFRILFCRELKTGNKKDTVVIKFLLFLGKY